MIPACYERLDPPETEYEYTVICPNCGDELHEGELVYETCKNGKYKRFACEHCIDTFATFVEDL